MLGNKDLNLRMLKIYVMHSLLWNGFEACQEQTLTVLTDFLAHFIKKLGLESKNLANLSGRTSVNIFDVILLLNHFNYKLSSEITDFIKISKKNLGNRVSFMNDVFELSHPEKTEEKSLENDKNEGNSYNIEKKKIEKTLKRKIGSILNEDKTKPLGKDFPSFYPNFPEEFNYLETKNNELITFEEAEIKKIKSMQKRQINSEISKMLEVSNVIEKKVMNIEKKEEIENNDEELNEMNPFNAPLKKIKTLSIHDITKSQLF